MIGEQLWAKKLLPGSSVEKPVPDGAELFGIRVEPASYPCTVTLLLDGRVASVVEVTAPADDGDFPGSGVSAMTSVGAAKKAAVAVSVASRVWGMVQ